MNFDLSTAFAVREREDGLLEKDTFDLSTATPIETTPKPVKQNWQLLKDPSFQADFEIVKKSAMGQLRDIYTILGAPLKWALGMEVDPLVEFPKLAETLTTPRNLTPGKDFMGEGVEGEVSILDGLLLAWGGSEALKGFKGNLKYNKSIDAMIAKEEIKTAEEAVAYNIAKDLPKYEKIFVENGAFPKGVDKETKVKVIMDGMNNNQNLKTEVFTDTFLRANGIDPKSIIETTAKTEGIEPNNLWNRLKRANELAGERGSVLIPQIGQKVVFEGKPGKIIKVEGKRIEIQFLGEKTTAIATLDQLSIPPAPKEAVLPTPEPQGEAITPKTTSTPPKATPPAVIEPPPPETKTAELPPEDPVQRVIQALKEAEPIRVEQEVLMKAERGRRIAKARAMGEKIGGEAGFHAQLGSLKGEMPKAQFETLRGKIKQPDIDSLFNKIRSSEMNDWDKLGAQTGLGKLFGEFGGTVPTENELGLLHKTFGKEFTDALIKHRTLLQKFMLAGEEVLNVPRAIMSSFDLSAPLRQGAFMIGRPKQFTPAFGEMFKFFGSEKALTASAKEIASRPTYNLMREHGLSLTDMGAMSAREERFMSNLAEKIPGVGKVVRASGRAYTGFLNRLRADVFDDLLSKSRSLGIKETDKLLDDLVEFINAATGRGKLPGKIDKAAVALNSVFFSPRLMASRLSLLNPAFYTSKDPFVRKEALKSLLTFAGLGLTILTLLKLAGFEVGTDWRSSDFGKLKIGNTRIDIWAGFQQYVRMAGQLITGEYVSSSTGKTMTLGEGYKPLTRFDIVLRQLESKEAPVASFITSWLRQTNSMGEEFNITKELVQRFTPMVLGDLTEIATQNPALLPLGILGLFGVGIQNYESKSLLSSGGLRQTKRGLK